MTKTTQIGELLRRERLRRDQLQDQAALRFGITQPSYSRWENGQIFPDDKHFAEVANFLGLQLEDVWEMVNGNDPRPVSLEALKTEIAELKRDIADLRSVIKPPPEVHEISPT